MNSTTSNTNNLKRILCPICSKPYNGADTQECPACHYPILSLCSNPQAARKTITAIRRENNILSGHADFKIGQSYKMGSFHGEDITWRVLDTFGDRILLLSEKVVEVTAFHEIEEQIHWTDCKIRKWLNTTFINNAFTPSDRKTILESTITTGGAFPIPLETKDQIFLLDAQEAHLYFGRDEERIANPSNYARNKGAFVGKKGGCWWWLRSAGEDSGSEALVLDNGLVFTHGFKVTNHLACIRPAMWIRPVRKPEPESPKKQEEKEKTQEYISVGQRYWMGNYRGEAISWRVLAQADQKALLLSEKVLDAKAFDEQNTESEWGKCTLRKWLNNEFIRKSFGPLDQKRISGELIPLDNYSIVVDQVFLLSRQEVELYLPDSKKRYGQATAFAKQQGAFVDSNTQSCWWWLRSSGNQENSAIVVDNVGNVIEAGYQVATEGIGVRPAIWITL